MYVLINIIMHLNAFHLPEVNVVSNFDNLVNCEKRFYSTKERIIDNEIKVYIKLDHEEKKYLEINNMKKNLKSLWFCKEIIFYKK